MADKTIKEMSKSEDMIYRVHQRLNEKVQIEGEKSQINRIFDRHLAESNEPYKDACYSIKILHTSWKGFVGECPNCKRKVFFEKGESERVVMDGEYFYPEKCYCDKVLNVEVLFSGERKIRIYEG